MLKIDNLSNTILKNISLHLDENLIILGSNGAGKSTLARAICGLIPSDKIQLFNKSLHLLDAKKRAELINYIPPKLEIFDEYISLKEYLKLSKLHSNLEVNEVMQLLGIEKLQDEMCKNLSSGEQQLTLMASAILHNAKLSIFDEPTANLDPKKTLEVYKLLKSDKIKTRIIITHDLNLAFKLGYKILYMQDCEVKFFDTNQKFFKDANLNSIFGDSLIRVGDYFMVNLSTTPP